LAFTSSNPQPVEQSCCPKMSALSCVNAVSWQPRFLSQCLLFLFAMVLALPCFALEQEPRKWNHLPMGSSFIGGAYAYTEADIGFDPVLTLENVTMKMDTWAAKYVYNFELLDKSARIDITQAYQMGRWKGLLDGVKASTRRSGWSDTFVRFAVNLYGAPPLRGKKFATYRAKTKSETIVGAGLVVRLPSGDYDGAKLINLSQNRYVIRPQIGLVRTQGKWTGEFTGEVAFHTKNGTFFNGNTLEQKPLYTAQAHLIRALRPGEWTSVSMGYNYGGESKINGVNKDDRRQNIGWALSYSFPINRQAGIKIAYIGSRTRASTGLDMDSLVIGGGLVW
jgi:hypothetical protein